MSAVVAKIEKPLNFGSDEEMENDVESDPNVEDSESVSGNVLPIKVNPTKAAELRWNLPPIAEKDIIGKWYGVVNGHQRL